MALDGVFLYTIAEELRSILLGGRIEKIMQPSKEEIMISMRTMQGERKLLVSANPNSPRLHLTSLSLENPKQPPMFCMLMRKHLGSGKLVGIRQNSLDRVILLDFETVNELGDRTIISIIVEIMGRHSNIILVNAEGKVIDAIKRINNDVSSVRLILPGIRYAPAPPQEKLNLLETDIHDIMGQFAQQQNADSSKALLYTLEGVSPLLMREIIFRSLKGQDINKDALSDFYCARIADELLLLRKCLEQNQCDFTVAFDETKKIRDFTLIDITQYGKVEKKKYSSPSELLDHFYADRDQIARMKQRSHDLLKLLLNATERITKKIELQKEELKDCANRDKLKIYGDLINSSLYSIQKGDRQVTLQNFYDENNTEITIQLDPRLSPAQNAQKYYAEYRKAATAETKLRELIVKSEEELVYLDSVFDAVARTQGESELTEIRQELVEQGYIRSTRQKGKPPKGLPPLRYLSSDGYTILCGRNNKQNDMLTLKTAKKTDIWFHTQGIAGSHVIVEAGEQTVPDRTLTEAAMIAACNSKGRSSAQVAVDYTRVRNVKKPSGAKPGMVIFTDYQTAYVTPDVDFAESLLIKEKSKG